MITQYNTVQNESQLQVFVVPCLRLQGIEVQNSSLKHALTDLMTLTNSTALSRRVYIGAMQWYVSLLQLQWIAQPCC